VERVFEIITWKWTGMDEWVLTGFRWAPRPTRRQPRLTKTISHSFQGCSLFLGHSLSRAVGTFLAPRHRVPCSLAHIATIEANDDIGNITFSNAYPEPVSPCNLVGLSSLRAAGAHRR
jgi:hypothetical protein